MSKEEKQNLDDVFEEVGGFGHYQIYTFTMYTLAVFLETAMHNVFIFEYLNGNYR